MNADQPRQPAGGAWSDLPAHRAWLLDEAGRLLDFARGSAIEGGFGWLDANGAPDPSVPPQLWITGRMTHVFALGHLMGNPGCGRLVDHGLAAIRDVFADRERGGWFAAAGEETRKEGYTHSFVLLAAASAHVAGREGAAELLEDAARVILERFWSEEDGACIDSWDAAWTEPEPYRGANANMHLVEAFLATADATGDPAWTHRAERIAGRLIRDVAGAADWRVVEHFDEHWQPLPDYNADDPRHRFRPFGITPGHGLEWARLLLQVRAALAEPPEWLLGAAQGLFERAVADGWQEPGGFVYTTDRNGRAVVTDRLHWVVTEAIGAAAALRAVTGHADYERWYRAFWDFAALHLIDREHGSWHMELDEALQPREQTWKGKPDVYHSLQATLIPMLPVAPSIAGALRASPL